MSRNWVIDASVGIKLYLPEDLSEVARRLFWGLREGRTTLFIPDLFYRECANILWKNVRSRRLAADHARESLRNLISLPLSLVSGTDFLLDALDLALEHGVTAYDASYATLAWELGLPLVTADEKLVRQLKGSPIDIRWLGDLAS